MAWREQDIPDQTGRVAVVTGANSGLGFETARALSERGATVVLACRSESKGNEAVARIAQLCTRARVCFMQLDLVSPASVRNFAGAFARDHAQLHLLINNAGVMMPPATQTVLGELQLAANHLGHFMLTAELWPQLAAAPSARVVSVSSNAHWAGRIRFEDLDFERSYDSFAAYAQSKLANLLFTQELSRRARLAGTQVSALAAHPGGSATQLATHTPFLHTLMVFAQSAQAGALPTLYAATAPDAQNGGYYGPRVLALRGAPHPAWMSGRARDGAVAAKLWALSEQRTGRPFLSGSTP